MNYSRRDKDPSSASATAGCEGYLAGSINENFYLAQLAALGRQMPTSRDTTKARSPAHRSVLRGECAGMAVLLAGQHASRHHTTWMTCGDPCDSALRIWGDTLSSACLTNSARRIPT